MYIAPDHSIISNAAHLRQVELATIKIRGELHGLDVEIKTARAGDTDEMAFIGLGDGVAAWCIYWMDGQLSLAFLPDASSEHPEGWVAAVASVEDAMAEIVAATDEYAST